MVFPFNECKISTRNIFAGSVPGHTGIADNTITRPIVRSDHSTVQYGGIERCKVVSNKVSVRGCGGIRESAKYRGRYGRRVVPGCTLGVLPSSLSERVVVSHIVCSRGDRIAISEILNTVQILVYRPTEDIQAEGHLGGSHLSPLGLLEYTSRLLSAAEDDLGRCCNV
jgi:hypothetical protein